MTKLTFLEVLNLPNNNLVGPIPHGYQFDTFDNDSYSVNLGLCGLPLSKQCVNHEGLNRLHHWWWNMKVTFYLQLKDHGGLLERWREIGNTISQGGYEETEQEETSSESNILL
ncbi:hypothetical protein Goshw_008261, partial [Gossypium schwendimanii]|nr:hypothetical protein [Gossypium schwendimanii]